MHATTTCPFYHDRMADTPHESTSILSSAADEVIAIIIIIFELARASGINHVICHWQNPCGESSIAAEDPHDSTS